MKDQPCCTVPEGLEQIEQRLIKLEMLLIEGLSKDISTHLDIYIRRLRQMRSEVFPANFFSDAVWDILLELNRANRVGTRVSISDLTELIAIPQSLLHRYVSLLEDDCLVSVEGNARTDHRANIQLTRKGTIAMGQLFDSFLATVNDDLEKARLAGRLDLAA